jgi:hypothetical protein
MKQDKVTESEMERTNICVSSDRQHKVVILQVNGQELYIFSPEYTRTLAESMIRAADTVEKQEEPAKATPAQEPAKPTIAAVTKSA